jgi:hypothetical protein
MVTNIRALPKAIEGASPMAKAVVDAFNYMPYGMNEPWYTDDGWVIAPTFAVKSDDDLYSLITLSSGYVPYMEDEVVERLAKGVLIGPNIAQSSIVASAATADITLTLDKDGHLPKGCTARALRHADGTPSRLELAFPHTKLLKRLKVDLIRGWEGHPFDYDRTDIPLIDWRPPVLQNTIYLYRGGDLVGFVVAKLVGKTCEIS